MPRAAVFSADRQYRYVLHREWLVGEETVAFVMLNPSTADEVENDPTVTRCVGYAMRWRYRQLVVLNIFALRSTDPRLLYDHPDPVGPDNERWFREVLPSCAQVVCAWGNHGRLHAQGQVAMEWIRDAGHVSRMLRITMAGQPQHPLYLPGDLTPVVYDPTDRMWRTLIRVVERNDMATEQYVKIVIPAWHPTQAVRLGFERIPEDVLPYLKPGVRVHARVNWGSPADDRLRFEDWEDPEGLE